MTSLLLSRREPHGLEIQGTAQAGSLVLRFEGNADMSAIEALDVYLGDVHVRALETKISSVVVDFKQLEFMNSSCFKCFVTWLGKVQDLPEAQRYRIVFASNRDLHWQRRSLNALRSFAMDVVSIEA
jgi:hypothetical protein